MAEPTLLPFYQEFYTESLFLVPETAGTGFNEPVIIKTETPPAIAKLVNGDTPLPKKFLFVGENKKGLILVFSVSSSDFAILPDNNFLTKILAAIQHTPADVAYVNLEPGTKLNIFDLSKETKLQQVVAFGPNLIDMDSGAKINLYKPAAIGQVPLLLAEPLHQIETDVNRKKYLWSGLQAIFLK